MLLEFAIADAYGAGFEYADEPPGDPGFTLANNTGDRYLPNPNRARLPPGNQIEPGCYTDDTQMSIAIAELLLDGTPWTAVNIAQKFVECFQRDPRLGYSSFMGRALREAADGAALIARCAPADAVSNGAAMRSVPIGVIPDLPTVIEYARVQSTITHDTEEGRNSAIAVALMSHYSVHCLGSFKELRNFLKTHVDGPWHQAWLGAVKTRGYDTVLAALTSLERHDDLQSLLRDAVSHTGDVDTVAAIAVGVASASHEYTKTIDPQLHANLEDGPFDRKYLQELGLRLQA